MNTFTAGVIYILGALTCLTCAVLLARGYFRSRIRLLMWSSIFFTALFVENAFLFLDLCVYTDVDLTIVRRGITLLGIVSLLFGLIWESE